METKQIHKESATDQATATRGDKLALFVEQLATIKENRTARAKDTSIKAVYVEFTPMEAGVSTQGIEVVRMRVSRKRVNQIVAKLFGCSSEQYEGKVISAVAEQELYTEYNQAVRKLLNDNKQLITA